MTTKVTLNPTQRTALAYALGALVTMQKTPGARGHGALYVEAVGRLAQAAVSEKYPRLVFPQAFSLTTTNRVPGSPTRSLALAINAYLSTCYMVSTGRFGEHNVGIYAVIDSPVPAPEGDVDAVLAAWDGDITIGEFLDKGPECLRATLTEPDSPEQNADRGLAVMALEMLRGSRVGRPVDPSKLN